jgi:hypothetical protein
MKTKTRIQTSVPSMQVSQSEILFFLYVLHILIHSIPSIMSCFYIYNIIAFLVF